MLCINVMHITETESAICIAKTESAMCIITTETVICITETESATWVTETESVTCNKISEYLKLVSGIFYQIFIFSPNDGPPKTMTSVFYFI